MLRYAPGFENSVHAEFEAFQAAKIQAAADAFSIASHLAVVGMGGLDASYRDGFGIARPYCHQSDGWGLFFEVEGPHKGKSVVTILKVANFSLTSIEQAKREAIRRWNAVIGGSK